MAKSQEKIYLINFHVDPRLKQRITRHCQKLDTTVSMFMRCLINDYFSRIKDEKNVK